jgi:NifU-like protein involved in Fe-S cluster formation
MHIFINVINGRIDRMKYLCTCDPTVNVAVETLCNLAKDKSLDEAQAITEDMLLQAVGTTDEDARTKAKALLELLNRGLTQYQTRDGRKKDGNF